MSKRHRREEIAGFLAERDREGLSYAELARRTGVRATTLAWWSWRLRKEGRPPASAFVAVDAADASATTESGVAIETPGGMRVRVSRAFDAETLGRVLALLSAPC